MVEKFKKAVDVLVTRHKEQLKVTDVSHKQLFDRLRGVYFTAVEVFGDSPELEEVTNYIFESNYYGAE